MTKPGDAIQAQQDDGQPVTLFATGAPGESGVSILPVRFQREARFGATPQQHLIFLQTSPHLRLNCRIAERKLRHEAATGSIAICPAGVDCSVRTESCADMLVVSVNAGRLALAAAEESAVAARLGERLAGYDQVLLAIARRLTQANLSEHPDGPLFWNGAANSFINRLVFMHAAPPNRPSRGTLGRHTFEKIREFVQAHLAEPIEVDDLAALAGRSSYHFSRMFARAVGITPHRFVVHMRLQAAVAQIRGGAALADVAAGTGFSDQSHLSRWIRRVHGVAPSELA